MKIILACFLHLDELPPMMTILKIISKKYDVLYIGVDNWSDSYKKLFGEKVTFINLLKQNVSNTDRLIDKIRNKIYWKTYHHYLRKCSSIIERNYTEGDLIWIHHEYSLMHMRKLDLPYYLTMYELHKDLFKDRCLLKERIKKAEKVIVPEYTRAAIVQACVGLDNLPAVIPNKPYDYEEKLTRLTNNPIDGMVERAHDEGKKIIIYSGIFLRERKLEPFIESVRKLKDKYIMVLIGRKSEYLEELLSRYPEVQYLGFYDPPAHLSVIEKADVGILTYVADCGSINPVFCAPNKIWEYAKYGMPMLCNDIPGLKYTVEYNHFGYCCDINSIDSICGALERIFDEYVQLSRNAKDYYATVDMEDIVLELAGGNP